MNPGANSRLAAAITVGIVLAIWVGLTWKPLVSDLFLPGPGELRDAFLDMVNDGYKSRSLLEHIGDSITRVLAGFGTGAVIGTALGLVMGYVPVIDAICAPFIEFLRPLPQLAYLVLLIIWFGIGETSKILLIYLAIFLPVVVATAAGVLAVDPIRIRVAQSLGATRLQIVRFVVLPSALPTIVTGVRIALAAGWSTLVAAELIAATRGLGFMIQSASQFLATDLVVGGIIVIAVVASLIEIALRRLQQHFSPWLGRV